MRALLLPVKDLRNAKQRLVGFLTPDERFELAQAMLIDTFRAARAARLAETIVVVTNYEPAMQMGKENGWEVLREEKQTSESASVDAASEWCLERGMTAVLRLPLDVPLVRGGDIDELLAVACDAPAVIIVPSRDGTGTNALLRTPATLFPSHFGEGSFAKHCGEARRAGAHLFIRSNARLEIDIDDQSDLRVLATHDLSGTETGSWLRRTTVLDRLEQPRSEKQVTRMHIARV